MNRSLLFLAFLALSAFLWSCKPNLEGLEVKVSPNPLEVHADSIKFQVRASLPPKSGLKKDGVVDGDIAIVTENGDTMQLTNARITAAEFPDAKNTGANIAISRRRVYKEEMQGGRMIAYGRYIQGKKSIRIPTEDMLLAAGGNPFDSLALCCITTSRMYCADPKYMFSPNNYEKKKPITLEAKFQFPQDISDIQPDEYNQEDIVAIGEFLKKKYTATNVYIEGFASPEGTFRRNTELSIERSKNVQDWLIGQLKDAGYEAYLDSNFFSIRTTSEDWEGFKQNLDQKAFPEDIKRQIIEIVSAGYEPAEQERRVMALVGGAEEVEDILAPLRRATIRLEGYSGRHTDEEIDQMIQDFLNQKMAETKLRASMGQEEFLYAISRVDNIDDKARLIEVYGKSYPDDPRYLNDRGLALLIQGENMQAFDILSKSYQKNRNNYAAMNNLAMAYYEANNYEDALLKLQESYQARNTPEAAFNMGLIYIRTAQYSLASEMFEKASELACATYNAGLAKLLMEDYAGAKADLETAIGKDDKNAKAYYLLAVVGARVGDAQMVVENLNFATNVDANLGDKAAGDLEYRKYFNNNEFKAAITK